MCSRQIAGDGAITRDFKASPRGPGSGTLLPRTLREARFVQVQNIAASKPLQPPDIARRLFSPAPIPTPGISFIAFIPL